MKEKENNNKPLMFIDTIQKVKDSSSQQYYDSRLKNKKEKKD